MSRKEKRIQNYNRLLQAGFSPKEARRLRDLSASKLETTIQTKTAPEVSIKHQEAQFKRDILGNEIQRGKVQYRQVEKGLTFMYTANYTYILTYEVKHKDGTREGKYIAYSTDKKFPTKADLMKEVKEYIDQEKFSSKYEAKFIKNSLKLIAAYEK